MLARGDLISSTEGALIASVPRQTVARWIREAGIDLKAARLRWLARSQRRAQQYAEGKPARLRPSKAQMRRDLARSMRKWNEANTKRVQ